MRYLNEFLGRTMVPVTAKTAKTCSTELFTVFAVPSPSRVGKRTPEPCVSGPDPCPICGYVHGTLEPRVPCDGCGSTDRTAMLVMENGARFCSDCLTGRRPVAPGRTGTSVMPKGGNHVA